MNEIQGALGQVQLKKLDYIISRQQENKQAIKSQIQDIDGLEFRRILDNDGDISTFLTFLLSNRDKAEKFKERMKKYGTVPATLNYWHFIANIEIAGGNFPESQDILSRSVSLEINTNMEKHVIEQTIDAIKKSARDVN